MSSITDIFPWAIPFFSQSIFNKMRQTSPRYETFRNAIRLFFLESEKVEFRNFAKIEFLQFEEKKS